jgi:hypothetical protein
VYFLAAFFDPGFLSYDLRQKYNALADDLIAITATVLDSPSQPVVTGTAQCNNNTGVLSITLNWADDVNTYTYDIDRDSLPLVTGLTVSGYTDLNVVAGTTYEYIVTGNGPMSPGFVTSIPVSVTTPSECNITAVAPTVSIISFGGRNVNSYDGTPHIRERQPTFTGTSSIPFAIVHIQVESPVIFIATVIANANGYWEWSPPTKLSIGTHTLTVTAIDPNDTARRSSASLKFSIKRKDDDTGSSNKQITLLPNDKTESSEKPLPIPIDFSLSVVSSEGVFQGQDLESVLKIKDILKQYDESSVLIRYSLIDKSGNVVLSVTRATFLKKGAEIREHFPISLYMAMGEYSLRAEMLLDKINISRTDIFYVKELPLIKLGGEKYITYAGIIRNLGWIALALPILLLLWLFMFIREYWMYLHALRHITEQQLEKAGFLTKRKGVRR